MTGFLFSTTEPNHWNQMCVREKSLFHDAAWQSLLADCFRSQTIYAWDSGEKGGAAITIFPAGPFKIGYLGFPLGGAIGGPESESRLMHSLGEGVATRKPVCIRIPTSAFCESAELMLPYAATPETAIPELQEWGHQSLSTNIRRNLKKAARSGLAISDSHSVEDGSKLFEIYAETIKRHKGSLRYNPNYFSRLIELSTDRPDIRVITARMNQQIAGFIVVITNGDTAYYLHGGTYIPLRSHHATALLFNEAIESAKSAGLRCFNFMSSPVNQTTLVEYKEKWGGVTRQHKTYVLALRPSYRLFKVAEKLYGLIR